MSKYSDYDLDIMTRTVLGEAAGENDQGQSAVAHVLMNRAADKRWPNTLAGVALQKKQFSAWNKGVGGNHLTNKYNPGDGPYERAKNNVLAALGGQSDATGGATHYYSPAGMQAHIDRGEQKNLLPNWFQQESTRREGQNVSLGGHVFTGLRSGADIPVGNYAHDAMGRAADPPYIHTASEANTPLVPEEEVFSLTGNETIDGAIGTVKDKAIESAVSSLFGGGSSAGTPAVAPPPAMRPAPRPVPVTFKLQSKKEKEK